MTKIFLKTCPGLSNFPGKTRKKLEDGTFHLRYSNSILSKFEIFPRSSLFQIFIHFFQYFYYFSEFLAIFACYCPLFRIYIHFLVFSFIFCVLLIFLHDELLSRGQFKGGKTYAQLLLATNSDKVEEEIMTEDTLNSVVYFYNPRPTRI